MRLKLNYDAPLSSVAFSFNLRRYNLAQHHSMDVDLHIDETNNKVGQCRLTL